MVYDAIRVRCAKIGAWLARGSYTRCGVLPEKGERWESLGQRSGLWTNSIC